MTALLLIHIVPFPAVSELFCIKVGQEKAEFRNVRPIINISVGHLPEIIEKSCTVSDCGGVAINESVGERGRGSVYNHLPLRIRRGGVPLFGVTEVPQESFPISIGWTFKSGSIHLKQPLSVDLSGRSFTSVHKHYLKTEWLFRVVGVELQNLEIGNPEPSTLVEPGSFDTSVQSVLSIARVFPHCGLGIIRCSFQFVYGVSRFFPDFVGTPGELFGSSRISKGSIGNLLCSAGLDVGGVNQLLSLLTQTIP